MNASQDFFATIVSMNQRQESGALFGITDNDRMLVIAFASGEIQGMRFGRLSGAEVVPVLETVELKSFSTKSDKSIPAQAGLPSTQEILDALSARIPGGASVAAVSDHTSSETGQPKRQMMYRGQVVAAEEPPAQQAQPKRQMMYRGQVVAVEEPPAQQAQPKRQMMYRGQVVGDTPAPKSEAPAKKSVRMYRGQVIA